MHYPALLKVAMHDKAFAAILETILSARFDLNQENHIISRKFCLDSPH
jgi:hypothetical protein